MSSPDLSTYKIIRFFQNGTPPRYDTTIAKGLSLEEAREHCSDPESSSRTCSSKASNALTEKYGSWFDGYTME
jgi:hypothetical protein